MTAPVVNVTEKHKLPMVAPTVGTTSIFKEGRKFIFMVYSPAEVYLEGFVELVARHGLKTIALIGEDSLFPQAAVKGIAAKITDRSAAGPWGSPLVEPLARNPLDGQQSGSVGAWP
jgi:ABC-type branched-subunit amino acid transport system substrate-binding protein